MAKTANKPKLFDELMEAVEDINQWREGKITLKTYTAEPQPKIEVTPEIIRETRENLHLSRPVFAHFSPNTGKMETGGDQAK